MTLKKSTLLVAALFLLMAYFTGKGLFPTEEQRIKKVISSFEKAVEKKQLLKCMSYISRDYKDDQGLDYSQAMGIARGIFGTHDDIFIHIKGLKIDIDKDEAKATFVATVFATRTADKESVNLLRERGSDRFIVIFRKEKGKWMIAETKKPKYTFE